MKPGEKKGILILLVVAIVVTGIVYFATRGNAGGQQVGNGGGTGTQTPTQQGTTSQTQSGTTTTSKTEFAETKSDGTTVNTSSKLNENKEMDGFSITNVNFTEKGGSSEMVAFVTNKTGSDQSGFLVDVVLLARDGSEIGRIPASILPTKAGETIQIRAKITENYVNAYDFKLEKK